MKIAFIKDITSLWKVWVPILEKRGYDVTLLDVYSKTDHDRLLSETWDAFIWRAKHDPWIKNLGKRFLAYFNIDKNIKTFPSYSDYHHYDDKIAQYYIFKSKEIPTPVSSIFYCKSDALDFMKSCGLPLVAKSTSGSGSSNVRLINSYSEGKRYIKKAFRKGIKTFFKEEPIHRYCYFQEFLAGNEGDYKITCFGNQRITGYIRDKSDDKDLSLPRDKHYKVDIPTDLLEFVSTVHGKLGDKPVMSYDVLKDNSGNWVITEFGVIFGDISNWHFYTDSKNYEKNTNGVFQELKETKLSNDELFIELLLKDWGWID